MSKIDLDPLSDGNSFPGKTYTEVVLGPAYEQAKTELLGPMMSVNKAHLIMLREQNLINPEDAGRIAEALHSFDEALFRKGIFTGEFEDLFFEVEEVLFDKAGEAAGNLHLGRSRNDMGIAIYRLVLRDKLLLAISSALFLQSKLLQFAEDHTETIIIGYTHTQQAQPTTLAHYILAVADSLDRDLKRLQAAFANCNRSSMGAAALTTSGFAVNREQVAKLLAFDGFIENASDAVSGADYVGEIATSVQLAAINLGRFTQELLLWCTQEFAVIRVAAPYVQISSIMPQKRNPVSIEHMRSLLSSVVGNSQTVLTMIHNTPFGDIVDTEDDLQPYAWKSLATLESVYRLLGFVIATLEVNKELLRNRTEESFATVTELADILVRNEGLSFRTAHSIVSQTVKKVVQDEGTVHQITLKLLNETTQKVIGRKLALSEEGLRQALDPLHFIKVRALPGGPNPQEVKRALIEQRKRLAIHQGWLQARQDQILSAGEHADAIVSEWSKIT